MPYANNKGADQPAHPRILISTFVVRYLDNNTSSFYIRNFKPLPSFSGCAVRFVSYLVANLEDRFSGDEAQKNDNVVVATASPVTILDIESSLEKPKLLPMTEIARFVLLKMDCGFCVPKTM